ncbi:MAG: hypothetical protein IJ437_01910 [Clostridia bacterium]|nr:hypothetical protein [Clostridia bacterium]
MIKTKKGLIFSLTIALALCFSLAFAICVEATQTTVEKPAQDTTSFVYSGEEQVYTIAESEYYTVSNNKRTNFGVQTVKISLNDKEKYAWSDGTTDDLEYTFNIQKATYSMKDVSFKSQAVIYDGNEHSLEIEGELPEGITVSYNQNVFTEPGIYTIIASFVGGNENYNSIAPKQAQLTIRKASLSFDIDEDEKDDVIISSSEGIKPTINLSVKETDVSDNDEVLELLEKYDKIAYAYDIKLMINEVSVQPENTIEIKIRLSKDIKGKDIRVLHIGSESIDELDAEKNGEYITVEVEHLSSFVVVYDDSPVFLWLWIVLIAVAVLGVGGVILIMMLKVGKGEMVEQEEQEKK